MKKQVLITLKRFSIYANSMTLYNVADQASIEYNIVDFVT